MGVGSGGPWPPWIFMHGTDILDRGSIVIFFDPLFAIFRSFFSSPSLPERSLIKGRMHYFSQCRL